ncbi:MAG: hypothetical protein K9G44_05020 [Melioribacteraceae bacterium]|nr:hypothetical protein [Melioribacteraceae bacterium]
MKEKSIFALAAVVFILLILNAFVRNEPVQSLESKPKIPTRLEIDSLFENSLEKFSIEKNWYERIPIKNKNYDSLLYVYRVNVPADLPLIYLYSNLYSEYSKFDINAESRERKQNRESDFRITLKDNLMFQAFFKIDPKLKREKGKIKILIKSDDLSMERRRELLNYPLALSFVVTPSISNVIIADSISRKGNGVLLLLNDEIGDSKYNLTVDYSKVRLKQSVIQIDKDFSSANLAIVDVKSELYNSAVFNYVVSELSKIGFEIIYSSQIVDLSKKESKEIRSKFTFHLLQSNENEITYFLTDDLSLKNLEKDLVEAEMMGYQILR